MNPSERASVQHVASRSSVHHSQHGGESRSRAPAGESKRSATPFAQLLDSVDETALLRPKQQDDTTRSGEPSPAAAINAGEPAGQTAATKTDQQDKPVATEPPSSGQMQHPAEPGQELKVAGDAVPVAPAETKASGEKADVTAVATDPEDDENKSSDSADNTVAVALVVPPPATPAAPPAVPQQTLAAVVPEPPTIPPAPAVPSNGAAAAPAATPAAAATTPAAAPASLPDVPPAADAVTADPPQAAANLKAEQPTLPRGKTSQKTATGPADADDSTAADGAPADNDNTAASVEASKPHDQTHAPAVTPDQNKPEHARLHYPASGDEKRGTDKLANLQATPAPDNTPAGKSADGTQIVSFQHPVDGTGNAAATTAAPSGNMPAAVPLAGLAVEIAARAQGGQNRFEIRLDPPELGRIHVHLDVDKNGQVTSHLVVDRVETLDALQRDAADLQRALAQAGLKTSDNGLQFTLRDQSFAGRDNGSNRANATRLVVSDPDLAPVEAAPVGYGRLVRAGGGVDIRV